MFAVSKNSLTFVLSKQFSSDIKTCKMKSYNVIYTGNSTRFNGFSETVTASSERDAVVAVYSRVMDSNYFPQENGSIEDCDGNRINDGINDNTISFDGGSFSAEEI